MSSSIDKNRDLMHYFIFLDKDFDYQLKSIEKNFIFVIKNILYEFYTKYSIDEFLNTNILEKYRLRMKKFVHIKELSLENILSNIENEDDKFLTEYSFYFPKTYVLYYLLDVFYYLFSYLISQTRGEQGKWLEIFDIKNLERIGQLGHMAYSLYIEFKKKVDLVLSDIIKNLLDETKSSTQKSKEKMVMYYNKSLLGNKEKLTDKDISNITEDLILLKAYLRVPDSL